MRQFVSDLNSDRKLFIGDYDSYTILKYGLTSDNLLYLTKLGLLIFDKLLLPAAFFWQSENMAKLLFRLEEPIERGIILPVIRNYESTIDIYDYFEYRMYESSKISDANACADPALASEIASVRNKKQVELLANINSYAHLDNGSIRQKYIENWNNDLENHLDINSLRLLLVQSDRTTSEVNQICKLLQEETKNPEFSRSSAIQQIRKLIRSGNCQDFLADRASWLYLKSNADSYKSSIYYSRNPSNSLVFEENLVLLAKTLGVVGLTEELINNLTINQILQIRMSPEYSYFIEAYRELIQQVYTKQENVIEIIQKKIEYRMSREKFFNVVLTPLKTIKTVSSTIFWGLLVNQFSNSAISTPVLLSSGTTSLVSSILMKLDVVNKMMQTKDFSDFKNYILTQKYERQILEKIGAQK